MYYVLIIIMVIIFQFFFLGDRIILGKEMRQSLVRRFKVREIIIIYCSDQHNIHYTSTYILLIVGN